MTRDFRPRYILFTISNVELKHLIQRNTMIATLEKNCMKRFNCHLKEKKIFLTRFNGKKGIIRCTHTEKQSTISLLESIDKIGSQKVFIKTIATSGTIKSLIKKHDKHNELAH